MELKLPTLEVVAKPGDELAAEDTAGGWKIQDLWKGRPFTMPAPSRMVTS